MVGNQEIRYASICVALSGHALSYEKNVQVHAFIPQTQANYILDVVHEDASSDYAILKSGRATSCSM